MIYEELKGRIVKSVLGDNEEKIISNIEKDDLIETIDVTLDNGTILSFEEEQFKDFKDNNSVFHSWKLIPVEKNVLEEKNAFNDAEMFVDEYKNYLVGKTIEYNDGEKSKIKNIDKSEIENNVFIELENENNFDLLGNNFQEFLDGKESETSSGGVILILQEECEGGISCEIPIQEKLNKSNFKYYVVKNLKICSGFEYKEDAREEVKKYEKQGNYDYKVMSYRELVNMGISPEENENWEMDNIDVDLIWNALEDSYGHETETDRAYFNEKKEIEESIQEKRLGSLSRAVSNLIKFYAYNYGLFNDDKTSDHYLYAKKYLIPLLKQSDIIGDLLNKK